MRNAPTCHRFKLRGKRRYVGNQVLPKPIAFGDAATVTKPTVLSEMLQAIGRARQFGMYEILALVKGLSVRRWAVGTRKR